MKWEKTRWPSFKEEEFMCKCGCLQTNMHSVTLDLLQKLRNMCGFPLVITSGYRCPTHNKSVSHTGEAGPHTTGKAVDIKVDRQKAYTVLKCALILGFTGIGVSQKGEGRFLHLDNINDTTRPTVWSY